MTDNNFEIKLLNLHWIKDVDDPTNLRLGSWHTKQQSKYCSKFMKILALSFEKTDFCIR